MPQLATDIKKPYRSNFCVLIKLGKHSRSITTVFFVWGKNKLMQEAIPFSYSFLLSNHRERLSASQPEIIGVIKISRQTFTSTDLEYGRLKIASIETKEVIPSFFLSFFLSASLYFFFFGWDAFLSIEGTKESIPFVHFISFLVDLSSRTKDARPNSFSPF